MNITYLRTLWFDFSFEDSKQNDVGFKGWLSNENYYINATSEKKSFSLFVREASEFKRAISCDGFRFGVNALQSVHGIRGNPTFPKLSAWHLIQAYYAAFFAAHSTLRIFGRPFINLEAGHAKFIKTKAIRESVEPFAISSGNHYTQYDPNSRELTFFHQDDSHKDLWKQYVTLLDHLSTDIFTARGTSDELANVSSFLSEVAALLRRNSCGSAGNWLSTFRNEINYRSHEEVWFPFSRNTVDAADIFHAVRQWKDGRLLTSDCHRQKSEIALYFSTCLLIVQIGTQLLDDYCVLLKNNPSYAVLFQKFANLSKDSFEV